MWTQDYRWTPKVQEHYLEGWWEAKLTRDLLGDWYVLYLSFYSSWFKTPYHKKVNITTRDIHLLQHQYGNHNALKPYWEDLSLQIQQLAMQDYPGEPNVHVIFPPLPKLPKL